MPTKSERKKRAKPGSQPPGGTINSEAFRTFRQRRAVESGAVLPPPPRLLKPTAERLSKDDKPRKMDAGHYRAPAPIERLRDQGKLDPTPHIGQAMYEAAGKLFAIFYLAGLGGIAAQDLSRCVGGGDNGSSHFPRDERALHNRLQFREAVRIMGWFEAYPHRGAGRLTVDVVCREMALRDAAKIHIPVGRTGDNQAAGMDRLREGLFALATHWNLI